MSDEFLTIKEAVQFIRECGYDRRINRIKLWNYSNQGPIGLAGHSSANHSGIDVPPVVNRPSKRLRSEQLYGPNSRGDCSTSPARSHFPGRPPIRLRVEIRRRGDLHIRAGPSPASPCGSRRSPPSRAVGFTLADAFQHSRTCSGSQQRSSGASRNLRCEPSLDVGRCVPDDFVYAPRLGKHRHMA